MKILIVHNAYGITSGEEVVIDNLAALLAARGLEVQRFSRSSAEIEETRLGKIPAFFSGIHNPFSRRAFGQLLRETRPEIVHIHNLYPLISPSILPECTAQGVPVVMTVHNFRLVCPNGLLLTNGELCHRCLGGREYWCVLRNCENSIFKSTGYALRTASARILRRYLDNVDHFICLSEFQKNILVGEGLPAERVSVLANPVSFAAHDSEQKQENFAQVHTKSNCHSRPAFAGSSSGGNPENEMDPRQVHSRMTKGVTHSGMTNGGGPFGDDIVAGMSVHPPSIPPLKGGKNADGHYVAYVGRVSREKGIASLFEAARVCSNTPFLIAGSWQAMPEASELAPANVTLLGPVPSHDLGALYENARIFVLPSVCYEGFPTVLLEAMSHGLPLVCSRIGGLPEIVEDRKTGLLYEPGNADELAICIRTLWQNPDLCQRLGEAGRKKMYEEYDAEKLVDRLLGIYEKAIRERNDR